MSVKQRKANRGGGFKAMSHEEFRAMIDKREADRKSTPYGRKPKSLSRRKRIVRRRPAGVE